MQNQFAAWIAVLFGFNQCSLVEEDTDPKPGTELVGTWMEVRTTYSAAASDASREWVSTERRTIIVEQTDDSVRFRNCLTDTVVTAAVNGDLVSLASTEYPLLQHSEADTLKQQTASGTTDVALYRLTSNTQAVVAQLDLDEPQNNSVWSQLCLETLVADEGENRLSFRAANEVPLLGGDVVVGVTFAFDGPVAPGQYNYPSGQALPTVSGIFSLPEEQEGTLSNPDGILIIPVGEPWTFDAELSMDNSLDASNPISIDAVLSVESRWFGSGLQ